MTAWGPPSSQLGLLKRLRPSSNERNRAAVMEFTCWEQQVHPNSSKEMLRTLREIFGTSSSVWGDLGGREARLMYRHLLPRVLVVDCVEVPEVCESFGELKNRARAAATARQAVKQYVRERSILPVRLLALAVDNARHGSPSGATVEALIQKYVDEVRDRLGDEELEEDDQGIAVYRHAYAILLRKSCETNRVFDDLFIDAITDHWEDADDDRDRAWHAFLLACAHINQTRKRTKNPPVVRAKWLKRRLKRRTISIKKFLLLKKKSRDKEQNLVRH